MYVRVYKGWRNIIFLNKLVKYYHLILWLLDWLTMHHGTFMENRSQLYFFFKDKVKVMFTTLF